MKKRNNRYKVETDKLLVIFWREKWLILLTVLISIFSCYFYIKNYTENTYQAKSIFGVGENSNQIPFGQGMIPTLPGLFSFQKNDDVLTQINGNDFLKIVITKLELSKDLEFFNPAISYEDSFFLKLKNIISKDNISKKNSYSFDYDYINEKILTSIKRNHLKISALKTGGYAVTVTSKDPAKAALIANTIVSNFLQYRLNKKINKSEEALNYLSNKLSEAKIEMEEANKKGEIFALERNVLSNEEFINQTNRLKEFRNTIDKIDLQLEKLLYYQKLINGENFKENEIGYLIDELIALYPRLKVLNPVLDKNGLPDYIFELKKIKQKLPDEISRLKKYREATLDGFVKLENRAKETSEEARELKNLRMNAGIRTARYQALLKEFETQSIVEGYKDAIGEIYQTATPPIEKSSPKIKRLYLIFTFTGLFFGTLIGFFKSLNSNKILVIRDFSDIITNKRIITFEKKLSGNKRLINTFRTKVFSEKINKEMLKLQSFFLEIKSNLDNKKKISISIVTIGKDKGAYSIGLILSHLFSLKGEKLLIIDNSSESKNNLREISKIKPLFKNEEGPVCYLNENISYTNKLDAINKINPDVTLHIYDKIEVNPKQLINVLSSDIFFLVSKFEKTKTSDLEDIKLSIGSGMDKCAAGIIYK